MLIYQINNNHIYEGKIMKFPIRHKTIFWTLLFILSVSLFIVWSSYLQSTKFQLLQLKEDAAAYIKTLQKRQTTENIYIAKAFMSKKEMQNTIEKEDKVSIEKLVNEITTLSFYDGGVILKEKSIIYKTKGAPQIDYTIFFPYKRVYPHKIYTYNIEGHPYGFGVFSLPFNTKEEVILYFNWEKFIKKMFILTSSVEAILTNTPLKGVLSIYPLLDVNKTPTSYLVFRPSKTILQMRKTFFSLVLFVSVILLAFFSPWTLYIKKEKETVRRVLKAIDEPIEEPSLEYSLDIALKTLYTHKVYRKALEVAINTKNVRETLRALATTLAEIMDSRHWIITLFSYDIKEWRFLLWSYAIEPKCLDEILTYMKEDVYKEITRIARKKRVVFLSNIKDKNIPCLMRYDVKSYVIIPMIVKDKTIGLLILTWDYNREFDNHDRLVFEEIKNMIKDILENTYNIQDMFWLSFRDPLLGIYNRRILETLSEGEHEGVLLYLDLDNFKQVNDLYGHEEGDKLLKRFVDIIKKVIRKDDVFLRYGGDEFILYLKNITIEDAKKIANRIKESVKSSFAKYGVTVYLGMVELKKGMHLYDKITEAEQKMYEEKREKRKERGN